MHRSKSGPAQSLLHSRREQNLRAISFGNRGKIGRITRMKRSTQRILTTHVGSLPRPDDLMGLYAANASDDRLWPRLHAAVGDIVRQQAEFGVDVVNDGEYGKAMRSSMDFGAW